MGAGGERRDDLGAIQYSQTFLEAQRCGHPEVKAWSLSLVLGKELNSKLGHLWTPPQSAVME